MDTATQTQIFFFISSVGFVLLWIFIAIFLYYLIRAMATFSRIMAKLENDINHIGDTTREVLEALKYGTIFSFLFKGRKKKHSAKSEE